MPLITPFDPWKSKFCTCPSKLSLSAYAGCDHGCLYCYASSYIRNFYTPRAKKDFLTRLSREIKKIPAGSFITIANSSDPYLSLERKMKLTQKALKMLKDYDLKIMLVTKSPLVLRDSKLLKKLQNIIISVSLTTLNKSKAKKLEPGASAPKARLKAVETLSKHIPVVVRFDPLIYPLNTGEIKKVISAVKNAGALQIITSTYKAKPDNFKRLIKAFPQYAELWQKLYLLEGEKIGRYIYLPKKLRREIIDKVKETSLKKGLEFSCCREGFKDLNTAACDGSSFFGTKKVLNSK